MFAQTTDFDFKALSEFIEKPSKDCDEEAIKDGIKLVIIALDKNPTDLLRAISEHPMIPGSYLLEDFAEKMQKHIINVSRCLNFITFFFN